MAADIRPVVFLGDTRKQLRELPAGARGRLGLEIHRVQCGVPPADSKKLKGLRPAVWEIRVRYDSDAYRAVYTVELGSVVYLLHVFQKKSTHGIATPRRELEMIRMRLSEAIERERNR